MNAYTKQHKQTRTVNKRVDAIRSDVEALQTDVKGLADSTVELGSESAKMAVRTAEAIALRALRLAEETATGVAGDVEDWANGNLENARESIRSQPISALLVSLGIGAVLGAIFLR
jgi:ElaB/YqjD/DUF883 family membrane-anchored ribosome-binding protein